MTYMNEYILEMNSIIKQFGSVRALDGVSFNVKKGEIHALCGENGAGKSTLMKVLSGVYPNGTYEGQIVLEGKEQCFGSIKDSEKKGIAIIYQELALVKELTVWENMFLGNEIHAKGILNISEAYKRTKESLEKVRLDVNPGTKIKELGIGKQQLIEISKALAKNAEILILDEPTAALTETESDNLLHIIKELKETGVTCIYISHKLNEVLEIADTITVLRDGQAVATHEAKNMTEDKIIALMVGRDMVDRYPKRISAIGEKVLEVQNWTVKESKYHEKETLKDISFELCKGEVLGISGLMGAGRTELAMSMFGAWGSKTNGKMFMEGEEINIREPKDAIKRGITYVSEDRKRYGLILTQDIKENSTLAALSKLSKANIINKNEIISVSTEYMTKLRTKASGIEQKCSELSGGNQQKVVLAKWLITQPRILILDEPTRGIDVGAKYEIYTIINDLVDQGFSVILISSELPEVIGMSDRVIVMSEGQVKAILTKEESKQETIMYYATGGSKNANKH